MLPPGRTLESVAQELAQGLIDGTVLFSRIHQNVSQDYIVTTEDKLRLNLLKYRRSIETGVDWKAPAGILATLVATITTVDFKQFLGLSADFWRALFAITTVLSAFWFFLSLFSAFRHQRARDIDEFVTSLKSPPVTPAEDPNNQHRQST